ncbi:hypothetical protein WN51_14681 [Melipona quadrifasciata]|uniref:Uncharacterized protein n=1 Tax=Melipona quadrifasciata TaxID=166423 RepID=A0A0M9A062_9HYME|nr:hypothetical protein WN51_14681 [Melipona quadrifasciata]
MVMSKIDEMLQIFGQCIFAHSLGILLSRDLFFLQFADNCNERVHLVLHSATCNSITFEQTPRVKTTTQQFYSDGQEQIENDNSDQKPVPVYGFRFQGLSRINYEKLRTKMKRLTKSQTTHRLMGLAA